MNLSHIFEKLGRTIFEEPFNIGGTQEPPEVAEIRFALLDEVRKKSYRSGGKRVFPYNSVRIHVRGVEDSRTALFKARLLQKIFRAGDPQDAWPRRSASIRKIWKWMCRSATICPGPGGNLAVDRDGNAKNAAPKLPARRAAKLTVVEGKANRDRNPLGQGATSISAAR